MIVFPFKILTPETRVYDSEVVSVTVSGAGGQLTVLAGHEPMLALLAEGPIIIRTGQETIEGVTGRGMLQVDRDGAAVMVHAFTWAVEGAEETEAPPAEDVSQRDVLL